MKNKQKISAETATEIFNNFFDAIDRVLSPSYSLNFDMFEPTKEYNCWNFELTFTNLTNRNWVTIKFDLDKNIALMTYRKNGHLDGTVIHNPLGYKDVSVLCNNLPV